MGNSGSTPFGGSPSEALGSDGPAEPETQSAAGMRRIRSAATLKDWGLPNHFEPIRFLGKGATSEAWLFQDTRSGQQVAIKLLRRPIPEETLPNLLREIAIHARVAHGHANIIDVYEAYLTRGYVAITMEAATGGSMLVKVQQRWRASGGPGNTGLYMREQEARQLFRQLLAALGYCHRRGVAHGDVKLENLLLAGEGAVPRLMLCDFGFATLRSSGEGHGDAELLPGTPPYMAPQLLDPKGVSHDARAADVWSAGVLLCACLFGRFPYDHARRRDPATKEARLDIWVQQHMRTWSDLPELALPLQHLSRECKDLLDAIFVVDEAQRISVQALLAHPWLAEHDAPLPAGADGAQQARGSCGGQRPATCSGEEDGAVAASGGGDLEAAAGPAPVPGSAEDPVPSGSTAAACVAKRSVSVPNELEEHTFAWPEIQLLMERAAHHAGVHPGDDFMRIALAHPDRSAHGCGSARASLDGGVDGGAAGAPAPKPPLPPGGSGSVGGNSAGGRDGTATPLARAEAAKTAAEVGDGAYAGGAGQQCGPGDGVTAEQTACEVGGHQEFGSMQARAGDLLKNVMRQASDRIAAAASRVGAAARQL